MRSVCSVRDCDKPHKARGWCSTHYSRWRQHGSPHTLLQRQDRTCDVADCDQPHLARGMCSKHYWRWDTYGDPLIVREPKGYPKRRFWAKVEVDESGCWLWTASTNHGYGHFWVSPDVGKVYAHRYAYELLVGPIPDGLEIDHLCKVRNCVNPEHLEPVTKEENWRRGDAPSAVAVREREVSA